MNKKLFLIFITGLILSSLSFTSCDEGFLIPQPVCEYGAAICQTLQFLCTEEAADRLTSSEQILLKNYLSEVEDSLQYFVKQE